MKSSIEIGKEYMENQDRFLDCAKDLIPKRMEDFTLDNLIDLRKKLTSPYMPVNYKKELTEDEINDIRNFIESNGIQHTSIDMMLVLQGIREYIISIFTDQYIMYYESYFVEVV